MTCEFEEEMFVEMERVATLIVGTIALAHFIGCFTYVLKRQDRMMRQLDRMEALFEDQTL